MGSEVCRSECRKLDTGIQQLSTGERITVATRKATKLTGYHLHTCGGVECQNNGRINDIDALDFAFHDECNTCRLNATPD